MIPADAVLPPLREDLEWIVSAATPEQGARLGAAKPASQNDRDRRRDQHIDDHLRLRGQLAADRRTGELEEARRRV